MSVSQIVILFMFFTCSNLQNLRIPLCCHKHERLFLNKTGNVCLIFNEDLDTDLKIFNEFGKEFRKDIYHSEFGYIYGNPCKEGYFLYPEIDEGDAWKLYSNGSLIVDGFESKKRNFCLSPSNEQNSTTTNSLVIKAFVCSVQEKPSIMYDVNACVMLVSVPFFIVTILVYALIPELRNLHGKCLICYLTGLTVGYPGVAYINYANTKYLSGFNCNIIGFGCYFFLLASFFWLSVIGFDMWWGFDIERSRQSKSDERKQFLIYAIYAWGLAIIMLIIAVSIELSPSIPPEYKSGLGTNHCWIDSEKWIQLFYFFGHIAIVICFNTIMFILTAIKIHKIQAEMTRMCSKKDSRNYKKEHDRFVLFLRLFILMGVSWSLETISWLTQIYSPGNKNHIIFYVSDFFNALEGFIIFILFVCKSSVKKLMIKRYLLLRGNSVDRGYLSSTASNNNFTSSFNNKSNRIGSKRAKNVQQTEF